MFAWELSNFSEESFECDFWKITHRSLKFYGNLSLSCLSSRYNLTKGSNKLHFLKGLQSRKLSEKAPTRTTPNQKKWHWTEKSPSFPSGDDRRLGKASSFIKFVSREVFLGKKSENPSSVVHFANLCARILKHFSPITIIFINLPFSWFNEGLLLVCVGGLNYIFLWRKIWCTF